MSNGSELRFVMTGRDRGADCDNLPFAVNVHVSRSGLASNCCADSRTVCFIEVAPTLFILFGCAFGHGRSIKTR